MKTQLLQDIDESNPASSIQPIRNDPPPADAAPTQPRSFAEQWRQAGLSRPRSEPAYGYGQVHDPLPSSEADSTANAEAASRAAPAAPQEAEPKVEASVPPEASPRPEAARRPHAAPRPEPVFATAPPEEPAGFAFDGIESLAAQVEQGPGWYDRWGRKAANWSLGLAAVALLAGAGVWVYNESKLERTLAAVAKSSPQLAAAKPAAVPAAAAPAVAVQAPPADAATAAQGPQLVMLNEVQAEPAADAETPAEGVAVINAKADAPRDVAEVNLKDKVTVAKKEAVRPAREAVASRRAAVPAATPPRRSRNERAVARLGAAPTPQVSERTSQLAETLKQCRIEGYHAQQCMKRGCVLTKYGLACKG